MPHKNRETLMSAELYTVPVTVNGRWTMRLPAYRAVRYLEFGNWEKERLASMALNISPDEVIYDIGTETGDMSALFAHWMRDGAGSMVLVEPNPLAWPGIKFIWEANDLKMPIATYVAFAGATPAEAPASNVGAQSAPGGWPGAVDGEIDPAHGFRHLAEEADVTPTITIDQICAQTSAPSVITIDIEGAELEALRGAHETLLEFRPLVWVSVHPQFMRHHFGQRPAELYRYMEERDYRAWYLADDHETHVFFEPK